MTKRIFRRIFLNAILAAAVSLALIVGVLYGVFDGRAKAELTKEAASIAAAIDRIGDDGEFLAALSSVGTRMTLIATDGTVLYDSAADAGTMENHLDRPEVQAALRSGSGESSRYSDTLNEKILYHAVRLKDGSILRVATEQRSILGLLYGLVPVFLLILALAALGSALLARRMAKGIVRPINKLNLDDPSANDVYDELAPLLLRLTRQQQRIRDQIEELSRKQGEFYAVTENMREGLMVLDGNLRLLFINKSACDLFGKGYDECIGKHILFISRSDELQRVAQKAREGGSASAVTGLSGRSYQLMASPVVEGERVRGVVLLTLDVTEKQNAEQLRREFTANVSHELKTPLTSIRGYAELIREGVVRPEDAAGFGRRIYEEADRMIALVEDIMKLSRLDEGTLHREREEVDLRALAEAVCERFGPLARKYNVSLRLLPGGPAIVRGIRATLEDIVANLVQNAVVYNKNPGSVDVTLSGDEETVELVVTDTGIGIPPGLEEKVFERFFRADASRFKETGGTGLGLSIVKRGAMAHGAEVSLRPRQGGGTIAKVVFPKRG
ncbi:MAG: ATP-binding protein [Bacillota bacterium]